MNIKIILASASPRRRELVKLLGYEFTCISTDADENIECADPVYAVKELSMRKANALLRTMPDFYENPGKNASGDSQSDTVIIGADTIVVCDGEIMGKPKDDRDAFRMLRKISGKTHSVYTGVTMLWNDSSSTSFAEETKVTVEELTDREIQNYIDTKDHKDKAGSYAIQGIFSIHIEKIHGDYNNVVGFPVARIYKEIKNKPH